MKLILQKSKYFQSEPDLLASAINQTFGRELINEEPALPTQTSSEPSTAFADPTATLVSSLIATLKKTITPESHTPMPTLTPTRAATDDTDKQRRSTTATHRSTASADPTATLISSLIATLQKTITPESHTPTLTPTRAAISTTLMIPTNREDPSQPPIDLTPTRPNSNITMTSTRPSALNTAILHIQDQ